MQRLRVLLVLAAAAVASSVSAAEATSPHPPRVSFHLGEPAGIRRLRPQTWGLLGVSLTNPGEAPADVLVTMYFAGDPSLQYARRLWVPAHARRHSWCPVFPPPSAPPGTARGPNNTAKAEIKSLLFDRSGASDVLVRDPSIGMLDSGLVSIDHSPMITALIWGNRADENADNDDNDGGPAGAEQSGNETRRQRDAAFELVAAARETAAQPSAVIDLEGDFLPPVLESLDGLDQLGLASDRPASDAAALAAIRRWLFGGGRLWVMLDRVDPTTVELLLGDSFRVRVVDRVGLTRVQIEDTDLNARSYSKEVREFEEPVELVRVVATGVEVTQTVNGWPASFWQRVGRGEVLFTTLGARAWTRPRTSRDPRPSSAGPRTVAAKPLEQLAIRFFQARQTPAIDPGRFEPYLSEQIGYRIVGRGFVAGVLGAFCLVLLAGGAVLAWTNRLERMAWIGPLAAVAGTGALAVAGLIGRKSVPPTLATAQLVEVEPGADDVRITGLVATYVQEPFETPVGVRGGGVLHPQLAGAGGTTRRMVWTDMERWHWENLVLPAGVRTARLDYAGKIDRPIEARASFGPDGLTGTLEAGPFQGPGDAVLVSPSQSNLAVELDERGGMHAGPGSVLAPGQFVAGVLLSDEQRRRQEVCQHLLDRGRESPYPDRPILLAWARPLDLGLAFRDDARQVGSALLAVPLQIEPAPPGTRVLIPSPLIEYRSVRGPMTEVSAAYSNPWREWIEMSIPSEIYLRFQVPREVLPIRLDRAGLSVRINAPSRTLEVAGLADGKPVTLATRQSPAGTLKFEITRPDVLQLDEQGGLLLRLHVGPDRTAPASAGLVAAAGSPWKIDAVGLEVAGEALGHEQEIGDTR